MPRFDRRATQVLIPTDGGKLAAASAQKSSSSRNSCSTSCCIQFPFDIAMQPVVHERRLPSIVPPNRSQPLRGSFPVRADTANIRSIGVATPQGRKFRIDSPHERIAECRRHLLTHSEPGSCSSHGAISPVLQERRHFIVSQSLPDTSNNGSGANGTVDRLR